MFKLDKKGQANFIAMAVSAVVGVICVILFATFYATSNTTYVSAGAKSMLSMGDFILAASVLIFMLVGLAIIVRVR